jgi:F-type H+-transporting ATPase subunit b
MKISWFTVIAQVVNFLILVWLMKRYLYKPVLNAIDEREKKITAQLADAATQKTEAAKLQDEFKQKNEQFAQQRKAMMDKAAADAGDARNKLMEAVRSDGDALRAKQEKSFQDMQEGLGREIAQKTKQEVFAISRKTLTDLASASLEAESANLFIRRLNELKDEEKKALAAALKPGADPAVVQSAFDLPPEEQTNIENAVKAVTGPETKFQFKTNPELISGIELSANGFKLVWSIAGYLDALEKNISQTIKDKEKPIAVIQPDKDKKTGN